MKTIAFLIIFEVFALFGVWFYFETKKPEPPIWKTDVTHIECVNDSLSRKLKETSLKIDSSIKQSQTILNQIKNIENEK